MTVAELLKRMLAAYPSFDSKAGEAIAPVYRARLAKYEGRALEEAYTEVVGSFSPTVRKPFPIAKDFEDQMPSAGLHKHNGDLDRWGAPIRARGEAHDRAVPLLVQAWRQRQGLKIEEARGWRVADACALEVHSLASARAWSDRPGDILLTAAQIQTCEDRVVSSERVQRFGALPKNADAWRSQMDEARAMVKAGARPARPTSLWKTERRQAAE